MLLICGNMSIFYESETFSDFKNCLNFNHLAKIEHKIAKSKYSVISQLIKLSDKLSFKVTEQSFGQKCENLTDQPEFLYMAFFFITLDMRRF